MLASNQVAHRQIHRTIQQRPPAAAAALGASNYQLPTRRGCWRRVRALDTLFEQVDPRDQVGDELGALRAQLGGAAAREGEVEEVSLLRMSTSSESERGQVTNTFTLFLHQ